jgi:hypothetical protein
VFNVAVLPELYTDLMALGHARPEDFHFHVLLEPLHYSIQILPLAMKTPIAGRLRAFADSLSTETGPASATGAWAPGNPVRRQFLHVVDHMMAADRTAALDQFRAVTVRLDAMRGRSTATACPELAPLLTSAVAAMPRVVSEAVRERLARVRRAVPGS